MVENELVPLLCATLESRVKSAKLVDFLISLETPQQQQLLKQLKQLQDLQRKQKKQQKQQHQQQQELVRYQELLEQQLELQPHTWQELHQQVLQMQQQQQQQQLQQ
eukprot:Awhi_evm1s6203